MAFYCYNRGCQKNFSPSDDPSKDAIACQHHPGLPYFHDAYKIWSCCQKKSTDFNTFLSLPGCTFGPHQPEKPQEPVTRPAEQEVATPPPPPVARPEVPPPRMPLVERPSVDGPLVEMPLKIAASLQTALNKLGATPTMNGQVQEQISDEIKPGTECKHAACTVKYTSADKEQSTPCRHHPGVPIFHEGMKYWSCCQKKTTDFETFTAQPGCTDGEHLWRTPAPSSSSEEDPQLLKTACRSDFHQQGSSVVLTLYAKMPRPTDTHVFLNAGRLKIDTRFGTDMPPKHFLDEWDLYGLVDVNRSTVELMQTKIEIVLRKAEPLSWPRLDRS